MSIRETQPRTVDANQRLPEDIRPLWIRTQPGRRYPSLDGDLRVDTAIVGAGITGLTAAALLHAAGKRVAVIDAREVAGGESGHTTAHLTEHPDSRAHTLIRRLGKDKARWVLDSGRVALAQIEAFIARYGIQCDFERVPAFLYTEHADGIARIEEEYDACRELDLSVEFVRGVIPLPFPTLAALRLDNQAQFHVRKYLLPLADAIANSGNYVFEHTRATEIEERPSPRVVTDRGVIHADDVVVAAHVPINNRLLLQTKIAHYRSYAIGARVADAPVRGLFWDDEHPYHYLRSQVADGDDILIVGGEDHRTGQVEDTNACFERLAAWTAARFHLRSIAYRWSGQIVEPVDGLPYIGRNSFSHHVWEATGFSGTGMTFGTLAGMLLCDAILKKRNPWHELYDATRITPIASAKEYVKENLDFPKHLVADWLHRAPTEVNSLERGAGHVFSVDGHRVAVYRDAAGEFHALSPACTHLHCVVEFNRAEKTWDCPCHGSRFDVDGQVLNGPAMHALQPFELVARTAKAE